MANLLAGNQLTVTNGAVAEMEKLSENSQNEVRQHLKKNENVDLYRVSFDLLPDKISPETLEALEPMIENETKI